MAKTLTSESKGLEMKVKSKKIRMRAKRTAVITLMNDHKRSAYCASALANASQARNPHTLSSMRSATSTQPNATVSLAGVQQENEWRAIRCRLMALFGHPARPDECPLSKAKRT